MRTIKRSNKQVAKELSASEIEKQLKKIGKLIKVKRKERSSLEGFSYEISISRSAMSRYEAGGDMNLSSFLKVLYGLNISPEEFFKEVK